MSDIFDTVFTLIESNSKGCTVFLCEPSQRNTILSVFSCFKLEACTGDYVQVSGKKFWLKTITSKIPKDPFNLKLLYQRPLNDEEKDLYATWKRSAK